MTIQCRIKACIFYALLSVHPGGVTPGIYTTMFINPPPNSNTTNNNDGDDDDEYDNKLYSVSYMEHYE